MGTGQAQDLDGRDNLLASLYKDVLYKTSLFIVSKASDGRSTSASYGRSEEECQR
jgi:hypothetical protein